jgi:glutamate/tyrosine decarboxylase-like PLP-dependent enzyme
MKIWEKKSREDIKTIVFEALHKNINFTHATVLGVPASHLDKQVFSQDAAFLKDAPFMSTLVQNPNNIGCHTLGKSESFFAGTQELESEVIEICAVDILGGQPNQQDGYVASGGTEANIQAIWVYRNFFMAEFGASLEDMAILCSEDCHYSMDKAANLLALSIYKVSVDQTQRTIRDVEVRNQVLRAKEHGKKHFIVVANMMTTMFGSVDDPDVYTQVLETEKVNYKLHVDGAYGGFYYPFSNKESKLTFRNDKISSFTLDAHKMAQAPYGTGIFLIRKGLIQYANTKEASYVEGEDYTLIGSRSGANAVAVWMILVTSGPFGWQEKVFILQKRTQWLCEQLEQRNVSFYRHPNANIVTIKTEFVHAQLAKAFGLVPDNHHQPSWYKIVIMDHVTIEKMIPLLAEMDKYLTTSSTLK